jgi:hypothetical protein
MRTAIIISKIEVRDLLLGFFIWFDDDSEAVNVSAFLRPESDFSHTQK